MTITDLAKRTARALLLLALMPGLALATPAADSPAGQEFFDQAAAKIAAREFEAALQLMRQAADAGHVAAIGEIGSFYLHGLGIAKDPKEAVVWYRRAAELGHLEGMHNLGFLYLSGQGVAVDVDQGLGWLRRAAEGGLVQSQLTLGDLYFTGQQVPRDYAEARRWFERAAATGNATAQASMATLYLRGYGVDKDLTQAVVWWTRAAEQGLAIAQYNLGQFYLGGLGDAGTEASSPELGIQWLSRAAEKGHTQSAFELAGVYRKGENGVTLDADKALAWLTVAANNGHAEAQYELGRRYQEADGVKEDLATARGLYRLAAQQGHSGAQIALLQLNIDSHQLENVPAGAVEAARQRAERGDRTARYELGKMYRYGEGVRRDPVESERWIRLAAEQGLSDAQAALGEILSEDEAPSTPATPGTPQVDLDQAADWFRRAAEQDHVRAAYRLGLACARGDGVPHDDAESLRWFRLAAESEIDNLSASAAAYMIGYLHFHGLGARRDWSEAVRWFERSDAEDDRTDSFGHWAFEHKYGKELFLDPTLAYVWITLAAEGGDSDKESDLKELRHALAPHQREPGDRFLELWRKATASAGHLRDSRGTEVQEPAARSLEEWVAVLGARQASSAGRRLVYEAAQAVREGGERAVPALVEALAKADSAAAVERLSDPLAPLGKAAAAAVPVLERLLAAGPERARFAVASALARIDPRPDTPALPILEACLADRSADVSTRLGCIFALDAVGGAAGAVVLIATLEDEDAVLRRWAIEALSSAPIDRTRAPLEARLSDPDLDVRLAAAARLLAADSKVPTAAVETLARDLCAASDGAAGTAMNALVEPRELSPPALEALAAGLSAGDPRCRQWTAVLLGRLDLGRATRALPDLVEAVQSDDPDLRLGAAYSLANLGCAAHGARAALDAAAEADSSLEHASNQFDSFQGSYRCLLDDLVLVATVDEAGGTIAYVQTPRGRIESIQVGDRFLDGEVERIEPGAMVVRGERIADDLTRTAAPRRVELFRERRPEPGPALAPSPSPSNTASDGRQIDVDFEGGVTIYLSLLERFGWNVILEPETSGNVRLVARRAPLAGSLEQGLKASGFSAQRFGSFVVVGRGEGRTLRRQPLAIESGEVLSLTLIDAKLADLMAPIGAILGIEIELPPGAHAPVTVLATEVPVKELLEALLSARGGSHRIDGGRLVVTVPPR